jgi:putative transposase
MGKAPQYTEEFKKNIVGLHRSGKPASEIIREPITKRIVQMGKKVWWNQDIRNRDHNSKWDSKDAAAYGTIGRGEHHTKKSHGHIHEGLPERIGCIRRLSKDHDVKLLCKVLNVSRSTYYAAFKRPKSKLEQENEKIRFMLKSAYEQSKQRYGAIKLQQSLARQGVNISVKRVQRRMKELGIRSVVVKKYRPQGPAKVQEERENIIKQDFNSERPNQKWVTDITYIWTEADRWTYLATVMDLYTKKAVGYSYGKEITAGLAKTAVKRAWEAQGGPKGLILHSDLGSQYTSKEFAEVITEYGIKHSFSKKGCPYDNACIESFHAILKKEEVYLTKYRNFKEAEVRLFDFIEGWYNRNRLHSSLGYKTPQEVENDYTR